MCPQQRKRSGAGQNSTTNTIIPSAIQWAFSVGGGSDAVEISVYKKQIKDFSGGPGAETVGRLCSQRRGPRFNPWLGN